MPPVPFWLDMARYGKGGGGEEATQAPTTRPDALACLVAARLSLERPAAQVRGHVRLCSQCKERTRNAHRAATNERGRRSRACGVGGYGTTRQGTVCTEDSGTVSMERESEGQPRARGKETATRRAIEVLSPLCTRAPACVQTAVRAFDCAARRRALCRRRRVGALLAPRLRRLCRALGVLAEPREAADEVRRAAARAARATGRVPTRARAARGRGTRRGLPAAAWGLLREAPRATLVVVVGLVVVGMGWRLVRRRDLPQCELGPVDGRKERVRLDGRRAALAAESLLRVALEKLCPGDRSSAFFNHHGAGLRA